MLDGNGSGKKKKVAVIGGGCAGMRAAIYADEQGHDVTLFEKTDRLGGQLLHGDSYSFKWPIANYKNWMIDEVTRRPITVRMQTEPTPEEIRTEGFDVVLAATGAKPNVPASIKGAKTEDGTLRSDLYSIIDCFGAAERMGKKVVICGGSESAVETAMYLCENGHEVTILTRQKEIAHDASKLHYITCAWIKRENGEAFESPAWERYDNLHSITEVTTQEVAQHSVKYAGADGVTKEIEADSIVICGGMKPCLDEAMQYMQAADECYPLGDCNGAGNIQKCTFDAYSRVMML
jgi:NADPH-dependent 2,4-dienoyl-CoA reductase/sulfur reductase-like enzyme